MLVRLKLGFEPIQNRSGLKKSGLKGCFLSSCLRPPTHPTHPSIPGCPLSSPATRRTRARLYANGKEKTAQKIPSCSRLCSRSEQLYQHQQNHQQRPLQGFTSTWEHLLNQLTLFTKERTRLSSPELYLQQRISGTPPS